MSTKGEVAAEIEELLTRCKLNFSEFPWRDISTAPKDGTEIVGWFEPNEVYSPKDAKPYITRWGMKQWKDGTGAKIGEPFGLWITDGWREPMSYAPTKWIPISEGVELLRSDK